MKKMKKQEMNNLQNEVIYHPFLTNGIMSIFIEIDYLKKISIKYVYFLFIFF